MFKLKCLKIMVLKPTKKVCNLLLPMRKFLIYIHTSFFLLERILIICLQKVEGVVSSFLLVKGQGTPKGIGNKFTPCSNLSQHPLIPSNSSKSSHKQRKMKIPFFNLDSTNHITFIFWFLKMNFPKFINPKLLKYLGNL